MIMNRHEYLQNLCDEIRLDYQHEFLIKFRGRGGWRAISREVRWFGDNGEYLGQNWKQAERQIRLLLG